MKNYLYLILLISYLAFADNPVDTTLIKYIDVTGDNKPEIIELHVNGSDFYKPFIWTITIKSDDDILYSYSETDSCSENRIVLEVEKGKKYEDAKRSFYFENFVELKIRTDIDFGGGPDYLFSKTYDGSIYKIAKEYLLAKCGVKEKDAEEIINNLVDKIKAGDSIIVSHTEKGLYSSLPRVYIKEVKKLIPIYSD